MYRKFGFIIIILFTQLLALKGQDAVFSQFYNSTLYLNPALAGIEQDITISANYREQWNALLFPYQTTQFSVILPYFESKHQKPFGHRGGIGLSLYNDVAGHDENFKTTGINTNFAYNLPLDKHFVNVFHFGMQAGVIQKRIDTSTLQWGSQYDPYIGFNSEVSPGENFQFNNKAYLDIGSGIFWWHNPIPKENQRLISANSGLSVAHMNHPNESLISDDKDRLPLLYKYHGGAVFAVDKNFTVSLNTLIAFQNLTTQYNVGTYFTYRFFGHTSEIFAENFVRLGAWFRAKDAAILLTEFESSKFKLGFSYDWNTSTLRYKDRGIGSYEFHFAMKFTQNAPAKSRY